MITTNHQNASAADANADRLVLQGLPQKESLRTDKRINGKLRAPRGSRASVHLDMVRGVAALAVFFGHARNLFLVDYGEMENKGILSSALYFLTGLGHESVMVFFVLSGYFISASILRDLRKGSWSWKH